MKTLFLDCSSKKKLSNSAYLMSHLKLLVKGEKARLKLKKSNYDTIIDMLGDIDTLVLSMPIYVDGVPSHILDFFRIAEQALKGKKSRLKLYVISNCGFYEGRQTKNCLAIVENWCKRCGIEYMGGLGIGAGEMLGIVRFFNVGLSVFVALLGFIIGLFKELSSADFSVYINYPTVIINILLIFVFNLLMYYSMIKLSFAVNGKKRIDNFYTTVLCPRFLFVIFADIFWILRAMLHGVPFWEIYKKDVI